ncbi:Chromatin remodeling protein EBS [Dichanthelium oligosanthes]|uniref:Chromatin remodeling protein EBS n=1 Tax=Dichanthelium oligosanthes TaxID=888268 RepID=A0A1E5VPE9_9POAL|nr:Chromatin remodeling protein EBS [Dichanthelium oligosanthes]
MRLPLHPFVAGALAHYGITPAQLAPNGWRVLVAFAVICHFRGAGAPLPRAKGWYSFRGNALFTGGSPQSGKMGGKVQTRLAPSVDGMNLTVLGLAVTRLGVVRGHCQVRCAQARGDVEQLLRQGHADCALGRAEHVVREQNALNVLADIEAYYGLIVERAALVDVHRECPKELWEAAPGLVYAAARCGDLQELQEVRGILTSMFGREFVFAASELRSGCGINSKVRTSSESGRRPEERAGPKCVEGGKVGRPTAWRSAGRRRGFLPPPNPRSAAMAKTKQGKKDVDSYTIRGTNKVVRAGDCVLMRPSDSDNQPYVARVEKMEADGRGSVRVRVRWYYRPEESKGGRRQFHGAKELFLSDHFDLQSAHTIEGKCIVHSFKNYTKLDNVGPEDFFCRFEYKAATGSFTPDRVAVYCKCEMPYNPDDLMVQCDICKDWYACLFQRFVHANKYEDINLGMFHPSCMGMTIEQAKKLDHFVCSDCVKENGPKRLSNAYAASPNSEPKVS